MPRSEQSASNLSTSAASSFQVIVSHLSAAMEASANKSTKATAETTFKKQAGIFRKVMKSSLLSHLL
jgi:hypothetical protein